MSRGRTPGSGRRSKGDRDVMTTRLPTELADLVRADAENYEDASYSELIANAVAEKYGHPPVATFARRDDHQIAMQMTA